MGADRQSELGDLGRQLERLGFTVHMRTQFGSPGIVAFVHHPPNPPDSIVVLEHAVFLYATPDGWAARVTRHGGAHWIRTATTAADLEPLALEALRSGTIPPSATWVRL